MAGGLDSMADIPYMENHVVDFDLLTSSSPTVASEELNKLRTALSSWGCFQLVNHGISVEFLDEVRDVGKQFLSLPKEEREKYSSSPTDHLNGYGANSITSENKPFEWLYRLSLTTSPLEDRKFDLWPENPPSFRRVLDEYSTKVKEINDGLIEAMGRCLNLNDGSFKEEFGRVTQVMARYHLYVPCSLFDQIRASTVHADSAAMTFLLQDSQFEALEVQKDGHWFKATVLPHALFVNAGDQMEIMSNGIFKSVVHRVLPHPEKARVSLPLFFAPSTDKEIGPLKELVKEDRPAAYKRVSNYGAFFFRYHGTGVRPITAVKV